MIALFNKYPLLSKRLAHVELAELPTPVERMARLGADLGVEELFVKRDDLSGRLYGGNKVRKLEFLLGQALAEGRKAVMTFGCAGSNHALATGIYAREKGLRSLSMFVPQPRARYVRRNLLRGLAAGVEFHCYRGGAGTLLGTWSEMLSSGLRDRRLPMIIPFGGTTPLGIAGFVNAALELREQVDAGLLPEPDLIYCPFGSMGTAVGLALGCLAAGMKSRVTAVRVVDGRFAGERVALQLFEKTNSLLAGADPGFPRFSADGAPLDIRHDYYGKEYALFSEEGLAAMSLIRKTEGIGLEGCYTGKALAALVGDARASRLKGKRVLFWNTYNSRDFGPLIEGLDYHRLPSALWEYYEKDLQPLDREEAPC